MDKLLELLGVKLNERFIIKGKSKIICEFYKEIGSDELFLRTEYNGEKKDKDTLTLDVLNKILNGEFKIIIGKVITEEQKKILRALKLLGFNYITQDKDMNIYVWSNLAMYKDMEDNVRYIGGYSNTLSEDDCSILADLVSWEDKKPVKIDDLLK